MPSPGVLLSEFERFFEARSCRVSAEVLRQERRYLKRFTEFCERRGLEFRQVEERHLEAYHHHLLSLPGAKGSQISSSFLSKAMRTVRSFFRWAIAEGLLLHSPVEFLVPRRKESLPRVPSVAEVRRLFSVARSKDTIGIRDRLILELLYGLGLRICECHRLDLVDFDLCQRCLAVTGKGGHQRLLPMGLKLQECYRLYLRESRPHFKPREPALFLSRTHGFRLGSQSLQLRVKALCKRAGVSLNPHHLRHACATHMLAAGADLRRLQEFLGHVRLDSTQRYTRVCPNELHQEFRRCHPRAYHR